MIIYPAIDLLDGACVRLKQGDFAAKTEYDTDPAAVAARFRAAGAKWLHMVDLTGAKAGTPMQAELVAKTAQSVDMRVQVGGGIRAAEHVAAILDVGVDRVIIGTLAIQKPAMVAALLRDRGADKICIALDVFVDGDGTTNVATNAWSEASGKTLDDVIAPFLEAGLKHILVTDIDRDGMEQGPNEALYTKIVADYPHLDVQASGGVRNLNDVQRLAALGAAGVITGRALYEGTLDLADAVRIGGEG